MKFFWQGSVFTIAYACSLLIWLLDLIGLINIIRMTVREIDSHNCMLFNNLSKFKIHIRLFIFYSKVLYLFILKFKSTPDKYFPGVNCALAPIKKSHKNSGQKCNFISHNCYLSFLQIEAIMCKKFFLRLRITKLSSNNFPVITFQALLIYL